MTIEEMYETAKQSQSNMGTCSSGQASLANLLTALEVIDWKDFKYRFSEDEIISIIEYISKKQLN